MDWFLSITTLLVNSGLGWTKGKPWMWYLHAINAIIWIAYALIIRQYGLILLSIVTVAVDVVSAITAHRQAGKERRMKEIL